MAFFEDQITDRKASTDQAMYEALESLLYGATGDDAYRSSNAVERAKSEIDKIIAYCGVNPSAGKPAPRIVGRNVFSRRKQKESIAELIERSLDSTGIKYRAVRLSSDFYKDAVGCFLAVSLQGEPVALIPSNRGGYKYTDPQNGRTCYVGSQTVGTVISDAAYCFYRPFPNEEITTQGLLSYMFGSLDKRDYFVVVIASLATTLLGCLIPVLNKFIFGPVVKSGDVGLVPFVGIMLLSITLAQVFIQAARTIVESRVNTRLTVNMQAAMMMRILSLPASFFKKYSYGNLANRFSSASVVVAQFEQIFFGAALTSVFSLVLIVQLFVYSPLMVIPALITILSTVLVNFLIARAMIQRRRTLLALANERSALEMDTISAIQKIKLAGAEKRMFSIWAKQYSKLALLSYGKPGIAVTAAPLTVLVTGAGTVLIYFFAVNGGVSSAADYMAFSAAFGSVSAAFATLNTSLSQMMDIKPHLEQLEPILTTLPESNDGKLRVGSVRGDIALQDVTFSYNGSAPWLFEGLSFRIKAGEHVAIVGETGCGKSTIMRLILGFELPSIGSVQVDDYDLSKIDVDSLRRNIGVILQDGALIAGSLFQNITIAAPQMSMDEAWEVAEMAGIADDIRNMPMGMMTVVAEDGCGISGGQRQRIMIARALAGKPRILLFDEATSALDNITQRKVAESLDALKCTRVVIAHRLSTVRNCDRILVLDKGRIVEQGTYEELMQQNGFFADLVERQQV